MNRSIGNIEIEMNSSLNTTPDANKKKPKQLTLFEMSSGGKFALKCDEELIKKKQQQQVTPTSAKKKKMKPINNENQMANSDCEIIEDLENLNPNQTSKKNKCSSSPFKQSESNSKSHLNNLLKESNMNKPSESIKKETNLVVEEQQQVKKPTKNSLKDFFSKSQANQSNNNKPAVVEAAAATTATTSIVAEEIKIVNRQLSNTILEETGSLAFMNMKSNETDEKLPNYLFGDLAMIIELNNLLCKLYGIKKTNKKVTKKSNNLVVESQSLDILEMDSLIDTIRSKTDTTKFNKLIKNLMSILIKQQFFEKFRLFEFDLNDIQVYDCISYEICKLIVNFHYNFDDFNELSIINPDENKIYKSDLLKSLYENKSVDGFSNLDIHTRIQLVSFLLHFLLAGDEFSAYLDQLHDKSCNLEAKFRQGEIELVEKLGVELKVFRDNKKKYYNLANEDKKLKAFAEKLKKIKIDLEKSQNDFKISKRVYPVGSDSKGHFYWHFSFYNKLCVEKKTNDEHKSEWYTFSSSQVKNLIDQLKEAREDVKFIKLLNEKVEIIYKGTEEDQDKKEEEDHDSEIEEIEQDSVDQNDLKSKLQQFERRVTRNFSKRNENEEDHDNDDDDGTEVIAHKNNNEELNESLQKWLAYFTNINSIDDLALLVLNHQIFFNSQSCLKNESLENLKANLQSYYLLESHSAKFEKLKEIAIKNFDNLWHLFYVSKILTSGRLTHCKQLIEASDTLSNLCFLIYCYFRVINWQSCISDTKIKCNECNRQCDMSFNKLKNLVEISNLDTETHVFHCKNCRCYYHKECVLKHGDILKEGIRSDLPANRFTGSGLFNCKTCDEKSKNYFINDDVPKIEEDVVLDESDNDGDDESRKLRKRKHVVDYTEPKMNDRLYPAKVKSQRSSASSISSSRSSFDDSRKAKKSVRKNDIQPVFTRSTRSSARLGVNSKPNYADNDDEDDDDTESDD